MEISDFENVAKDLDAIIKKMNSDSSLNGFPFALSIANKSVFDFGDKILRVESPMEIYKRILILQYMNDADRNPFLEEELLDFSTSTIAFTVQRKIEVIPNIPEKDVLALLSKKTQEMMKPLGLCFFGINNCGKENGQIKIFDYVSNTAVSPQIDGTYKLIGANGECLYRGRI